MTDEIKKTHIDFDFSDDLGYQSKTKEAVLFVARTENIFKLLGEIEVSPKVVEFVRYSDIREGLEQIVNRPLRIDITSSNIPFLMRAELVDAYFQYRIGQHLESLDEIEVFIPENLRDKLSKPLGYEVFELARSRGLEIKEPDADALRQQQSAGLYSLLFPNRMIASGAPQGSLGLSAGTLTSRSSGKLVLDSLGGQDALNRSFLMHVINDDYPLDESEEARFYDALRFIFQEDGKLPATSDYKIFKLKASRYKELSTAYKRIVNTYIVGNLKDARNIKLAATMFPGEIELSVAMRIMLSSISEISVSGIRIEGEEENPRYYFDNDKRKDLDMVAYSARKLLESYSKIVKVTALQRMELFDLRGSRQFEETPTLLDVFGRAARRKSPDSTPIEGSTIYDLMQAHGEENQREVYNAFTRLYGRSGFVTKGTSWDESINIRIEEDGRLTSRIGYSGGGWVGVDFDSASLDDEPPKVYDFIARAKEDRHFRIDYFNENIRAIVSELYKEIKRNYNVKQASLAVVGETMKFRLDEQLLLYIQTGGDPGYQRLADIDERVVALQPFVAANPSSFMQALDISELTDRKQVQTAYRRIVKTERIHPDTASEPEEKARLANRLNDLTRARNELLRILEAGVRTDSGHVSTYLGKISYLLD